MAEAAPKPDVNNVSVKLLRYHLDDVPVHPFPPGYGVRPMRLVDAGLWEDIWRDAEPFLNIRPGLFEAEFGSDAARIAERCFLVTNPRGCSVGTVSAWNTRTFKSGDWGQIHWIAIRPGEQGKGLAKAAMTYALQQLGQWHKQVWLGTSTGRVGAIKLYLDFGFVPDMDAPWAKEAWDHMRTKLDHPALR